LPALCLHTLLIRHQIARLQALLDEKLAEIRHEERSLRVNAESWVVLTDMSEHIKTQFPDLKKPIDIFSPGGQNELDASKLVMSQDIHLVQTQASMQANYKRICEIFKEAQEILDQLKVIDKNHERYANMHGLLNGLDKPRADWETTIKRLASIIRQLG
jgi:hypothetical protein